MTGRAAAIVGVGMSRFSTRREDVDLVELYQEATVLALADAGIDSSDIDLVVVAQAPDALHGIANPERFAPEAIGRSTIEVVRVHTGGATGASAVQAASWAVASGRYECVLVIGAEKMGDNVHGAQEVLNKIWDPAYEAALPLNTISICALAACRRMALYGETSEQYAAIASRLRRNGARNPNAHLRREMSPDEVLTSGMLCEPLTMGMSCPRSTGACAVIVASGEFARKLSATEAWIRGVAACTNTYFIGDRMSSGADPNQYGLQYELRLASQRAYEQAGICNPSREVDVVEPYAPFASLEPTLLEAMGFAEPGTAAARAERGDWDIGGDLVVSPSGGVLCTNPISVTAMVQVAEAAQQVRGRSGPHQVEGARVAVACGVGGANQFGCVFVLDAGE